MSTPRLPTCIMVVSMLWRNPSEGSSRPCRPSLTKMLKRDSPPPSAYFVFGHEVRGDIRSNRFARTTRKSRFESRARGEQLTQKTEPVRNIKLVNDPCPRLVGPRCSKFVLPRTPKKSGLRMRKTSALPCQIRSLQLQCSQTGRKIVREQGRPDERKLGADQLQAHNQTKTTRTCLRRRQIDRERAPFAVESAGSSVTVRGKTVAAVVDGLLKSNTFLRCSTVFRHLVEPVFGSVRPQ